MKKISNFIILILVIIAIIILAKIVNIRIASAQNEEKIKGSISQIKEELEQTDVNENQEVPYIEYQGYQVIGIIKIDKINIEYPILNVSDETSMKKSITKFWGDKVNQNGNLTLAGHNNVNGTMFGKIKKLEIGDKITISDLYNNSIIYEIFDKYITDPNDVNTVKSIKEDTKEITLITCTNGNKNRLIVKAREI